MLTFDKNEIRNELNIDIIFDFLNSWGAEPEYTDFGLISTTICHNKPGEGSRKLYYYDNSGLFKCYTGCDASFDIFELAIKVYDQQLNQTLDLNDAVRLIAAKIGYQGEYVVEDENQLEDWKVLANYERIQSLEITKRQLIEIKECDNSILNNLNYNLIIQPWLDEGITQEVLNFAKVGYYLGGDQITIPHYDCRGRFVGLRGRALCQQEAELFGKYRPLRINNVLYNHPLGANLYGLNWARDNIKSMKKVIVFEAEKSVLKYMSYFGINNNIAVATCGSSLSAYQVQLLLDSGAEEIILAYDRQFKEIGDDEFLKLKKNLLNTREKYKNIVKVNFIFDKNKITGYKDAPIDKGANTFLQLFKERIVL